MPSVSEGPTFRGDAPPAANFRDLLEVAPDAMVGVDRAGLIQFVNRHTESLFGYAWGALVGLPIETLVPESFRTAHRAHRANYVADPKARPMGAGLELTGRRRDGSEFPVDVSLSHIGTGDDQLVIAAVRDLTARHEAEEARRQSDRMSAMIEFSGEAIISTTLSGAITSWNRAAERLFGYSNQEAVGESVELLSPEDRTGEMRAILDRFRAGEPVERLETIRARKDGTVFPASLSVSPIRHANGAIVGASTITRDMTKEKEAFESARSMIESSLDSLVAISPEGMITDVNEATVKVTGIPRDELIGTAFSECFTEPGKANAIYQLVFEQGMAVDYPLTMRHRDGTLTEVLYNASVYRDAGGNVLGVFAAARDVTEQKLAAETARSLAAAEDPLVTISPEGKITDVNEATIKV